MMVARFVLYGIANLVFLYGIYRLTRTHRICGPNCKHTDTPVGKTRYVMCQECPLWNYCKPEDPCEFNS